METSKGLDDNMPRTPPPLKQKSTEQKSSTNSSLKTPPPLNPEDKGCRSFILNPEFFRYDHETDILYTTTVILGVALLIFSYITLGIILVCIGTGIAYLKIRQHSYLGQCVKVSEKQFANIHEIAATAAERLGVEKIPVVYIQQSPVLNAYAQGFKNSGTVVLHTALVEALDEKELQFTIGHEFSHIKCGHTFWLMITGNAGAKIPVISSIIDFVYRCWSRLSEYTCDRGGLIACRDLNAAIRTQAKLAVGSDLFDHLDIAPFLEQKSEFDKGFVGMLSESMQTHPMIVNRIKKLMEFAESENYKWIASQKG